MFDCFSNLRCKINGRQLLPDRHFVRQLAFNNFFDFLRMYLFFPGYWQRLVGVSNCSVK